MSVYVFTGPTLAIADARAILDAVYLPPVSQGDLYRVATQRPVAIGIIDGHFNRVPAVWHKEILWAMSQGIHVFGSASMGALRAAELAHFGMEGVGVIFEAYQNGLLEDDDEVAVVHASSEFDFRPSSEAMVNIRPTIRNAVASGIISSDTGLALTTIAKSLFYPERTYFRVLELALDRGVSTLDIAAFKKWLPGNMVNQKRDDALEMLRVIAERVSAPLAPKRVTFQFQTTTIWELARSAAMASAPGDFALAAPVRSLLDEIRLDTALYLRIRRDVLLRCLALSEWDRTNVTDEEVVIEDARESFMKNRGMKDEAELTRWMTDNDVKEDESEELLQDEGRVTFITELYKSAMNSYVVDQLRLDGRYRQIVERARAKNDILQRLSLSESGNPEKGITTDALLKWYFEDCHRRSVPVDLDHFSLTTGFNDVDDLIRALSREYLFRQHDC